MAVDTELQKLVSNLNKTNKQLVENRKALGTEAQKELATQISEQKTEFSSFLASRKMKKAEMDFDKTRLEDAQRIHEANIKMQEDAIKNDPTLKSMKLEEDRIREELRLNEQSSNNAKRREKLNKELNENIKEQSSQRQTVEGKFSEVVSQSSDNLESATKEYTDVLKQAGESESFNKFTSGLKTLTGGLVDIAPIFDDILKYGNAIKDVATGTLEFTANLSETLQGFETVFGKEASDEMRESVKTGLKNLFSGMFKAIGAYLLGAVKVFGAFFTSVKLVFSTLLSGDAEMLPLVVGNMFKKLGTLIKSVILAPFKLLIKSVGFMVNSVLIPIITGLTKILSTILKGVLMALRTMVVSLVTAIAGLGAPFLIIAAGVALLGLGIYLAWDFLKEKWEGFTTKVKEIATKIGDFASNMGEKIMESFQKAIDKVKDLGGRLGRRILKFFGFGGDDENLEESKPMPKQERLKYMEGDGTDGKGVGYNPEDGTIDKDALLTGNFTKTMLQDLLDTDNLTDDSRSAIESEMRSEKYNNDSIKQMNANIAGLVWDKDSMSYMSSMDYAMRTPNTGGEIENSTIELNEATKQSGGNMNTVIKGGDTVSSSTTFIPPSGNPRNSEPSAARGAGG